MLTRLFGLLQKIGRALMLPVSVLPVAGLLLGVGSAHLWFVPDLLAEIMARAGDSILANLPLLFALGVALGLCDFEGVAAVAAAVGYFVMLASLGCLASAQHHTLVSVLGIETLQTGVFGGILVGMVAAGAYRRFYRLELPPYLGFFAGKRSVPIITGMASLILGALLSLAWPPAQRVIEVVADRVANDNPAVSAGLWAVVNRALIPFGLHHIWNNPFFFLIGSYSDPSGGGIKHGDIYRFLAGDRSAGILGGGYLFSLFGLPAACLAMWRNAASARRKEVGGLLASAALTSILTGITEPVEFAFLFVAPGLYAVHAVLAGLACWLMVALGGHLGITFSFGLIDYFVLFPLHTRPWLVWVLGPFFGLAYYAIFDWAIRRFHLVTLGREQTDPWSWLGGRDNVRHWEWCGASRLRLQVVDSGQIRPEGLGMRGMQLLPDGVVHLLVGPEFDSQWLERSH
ncbi:PTS transporter subunit EIIC [bacterium]|nr:PTS transporter subunit EIIC [bacterium]